MASAIPAEKRTRTVAVRLTPGEESAWVTAALAAGRRQLGAWVREVAVAGLRAELARLGNNVNQIAHALNTPGHPHADAAVAAAEPHLAAISSTLAELYEAIERAETRAR